MSNQKNSSTVISGTIIPGSLILGGAIASDSSPGTGAGKAEENLKNSTALLILINASAQAVTRQPKFIGIEKLDGLKEANKHLELAQSHANDWLKVHSKAVLSTLQGVISFGRFFNELYSPLYTAAKLLGNETSFDQEQINALVTQLQALQMDVQEQYTAVNKIYNDLMTFQAQVNSDYSNFMTHINKVNSTLAGDKGALNTLQEEIKIAQEERSGALLQGILGTIGAVAGGIMIVIGAVGTVFTGGASVALIVVGTGLFIGGGIAGGFGFSRHGDLLEKISYNTSRIAEYNTEIAILNTLNTQFTDLTTNLKSIGEAVNKLSSDWKVFDNQLSQLIVELQNPQNFLEKVKKGSTTATPAVVATIVAGHLATAQSGWNKALERAEIILENYIGTKYVATDKLPTPDNIEKHSTVIA